MKTPLLLAALLLVAPAAARADTASTTASTGSLAGSEDPNMSGSTKRMFIINATTPGALTFSGAGTATFNNAVGTNNQFNVGSTTSIGVEASVSATQEFDGLASGLMQMGEGSNLMQTNGTSTAAASIQAAAVAANNVAIKEATSVAHDAGFAQATTLLYGIEEEDPDYPGYFIKVKDGIGSPYFGVEDAGDYGTFDTAGEFVFNDLKFNRDFDELSDSEKKQLVQDYYRTGANDTNFNQLMGFEQQKYDLEDNAWLNDLPYSSIADQVASLDAEIAERELVGAETVWGSARDDFQKFKNAYNTERNKAYNNAYENSFNTVITKSSLNISESTETGQIKGTFKTNSDTTTAIGTEAQLDAVASSALTTANATGDSVGGTSWTAAFNQAYEAGYASSVGNSTVKTDSEVLVLGLGAIASVNTDTKSMFTVNLDRLDAFKTSESQDNSSATANGAATSTLSTNSFATQNSQRTASAFMQAFAANDETTSTSSSTSSSGG